jgi:hypothetical protein
MDDGHVISRSLSTQETTVAAMKAAKPAKVAIPTDASISPAERSYIDHYSTWMPEFFKGLESGSQDKDLEEWRRRAHAMGKELDRQRKGVVVPPALKQVDTYLEKSLKTIRDNVPIGLGPYDTEGTPALMDAMKDVMDSSNAMANFLDSRSPSRTAAQGRVH